MSDLDDSELRAAPPGSASTGPQLPFPGVFAELGALPPTTLITEEGLARMLDRSVHTIQRAVKRGELPAPARFCGKPTWTAGAIIRHHERRMEQEERDAQTLRKHAV